MPKSLRIPRVCAWLNILLLVLPGLATAATKLPKSIVPPVGQAEKPCVGNAVWRKQQVVDGVEIQESPMCNPDDPATIAAFVKGTNNISMDTLMDSGLAADAITKENDRDGDGDPDDITIRLEVVELNGHSPDMRQFVPTFNIAPGIQPGFWVFAPKTQGMSTKSFISMEASPLLRMPSPSIRVEQGDRVKIVLENTHYFPHTIHLHGVDHPYVDASGEGNDGVPEVSEDFVWPGQTRTYDIEPRQTGTMLYHCHVQPHAHIMMGLKGMLIVEENRPNNWVQTFNVGLGQVRHPSVAILEEFDQEYDLQYTSVDTSLNSIIQKYNDPRLIAKAMNQEFNMTHGSAQYFLLNGRSFPYTLRESLITVEPDQNIKIRMLNAEGEMIAVHTHGHKATMTHYDGVEQNPVAQITRDVYDLAPAQRLDLKLSTVNDGRHNYGPGVWPFHDHVEKGVTTAGQNPGGTISAIVYRSFLAEDGMPITQGVDNTRFFTKEFYQRKVSVWAGEDDTDLLADIGGVPEEEPGGTAAARTRRGAESSPVRNLVIGLLLGGLLYYAFQERRRLAEIAGRVVTKSRGDK